MGSFVVFSRASADSFFSSSALLIFQVGRAFQPDGGGKRRFVRHVLSQTSVGPFVTFGVTIVLERVTRNGQRSIDDGRSTTTRSSERAQLRPVIRASVPCPGRKPGSKRCSRSASGPSSNKSRSVAKESLISARTRCAARP